MTYTKFIQTEGCKRATSGQIQLNNLDSLVDLVLGGKPSLGKKGSCIKDDMMRQTFPCAFFRESGDMQGKPEIMIEPVIGSTDFQSH
jgi:hypothetical protein